MVLIAVIIFTLPFYQDLITDRKEKGPIDKYGSTEIKKAEEPVQVSNNESTNAIPESVNTEVGVDSLIDNEKKFSIENDLLTISVSNVGANPDQIQLNKYKKSDSSYVNIINDYKKNGFSLGFYNLEGNYVDLNRKIFALVNESSGFKNNDLKELIFEYNYSSTIFTKKYIFNKTTYDFKIIISVKNPEKNVLNNKIEFGWKNGIPVTEPDEADDNIYNQVYLYTGDELTKVEITEENTTSNNFTGQVDWVINRSKYFLIGLIPEKNNQFCEGVNIKSIGKQRENFIERKYSFTYDIKVSGKEEIKFNIYSGPLDHRILKKHSSKIDLIIMNNGWYERIFRPISLLILPVLEWLYRFIPNYGLVIIIFSLIVKIILHPLTKKSYESMKEMQVIQPLMAEVREKYKNDPQRMNKEMMALYKEYGINPLGGCLPVLLQMPLLFALFNVFKSTIQLRGASFIPGWIPDLSRSEGLFIIPFNLPMYGNEVNILPILMAVSMIFQSKMTMTDPKQKAMVYMMPIMMLLFFNSFPSGLNLYYTAFNVFTILQQKFITHETKPLKK